MTSLEQFRLVAAREIRESFRRRSVRIVVGLLFVLSSAGVVLPDLLGDDDRPSYDVALDSRLGPRFEESLVAEGDTLGFDVTVSGLDADDQADVERQVREEELDAAVLEGTPPRVVVREDGAAQLQATIAQVVSSTTLTSRLEDAGLDRDDAARLVSEPTVTFQRVQTDEQDEATGVGAITALVVYVALLAVTVQVANGTAVEKSSRISEVLLAVVRPGTLLFGKVVGVGVVSLAGIGALMAPVLARTLLGASVPAATIPTIAAGVVWFLLGLAFYAPVSGGLGALVERQEEVGTAVQPLTIALIGGFFAAQLAADTVWAFLLAVLPVTSPLVVPARVAAGDTTTLELALSATSLVIAALVAVRLGGVVYRRAIVRTGRRLSLRDVLRS